MEDGRRECRFEPIDTVAWLHGVADEFRQSLDGRPTTLVADTPTGLLLVAGDRAALATVLQDDLELEGYAVEVVEDG